MRAIYLNTATDHGLDALTIGERPQPQPAAEEILVRVHAVGLNPVDYKLIEGGNKKWQYPHILGLDVAGEIVALGPQVSGFAVGERVFYHGDLTKDGGFAEYATVKSYAVAKMPAELSYEQAAALLCGAMTAYAALYRKASLANRHTVLIHAGAGGVGGIAVQLAKHSGLTVYTTASSRKRALAKRLLPDHIIDYQTTDVTAAIKELTHGHGVDLIINTVGTKEATADLQRLAYNGALVTIVGGPDLSDHALEQRGQSWLSVNLGGAHQSNNLQQQTDLAVMAAELGKLVVAKQLDPLIERVLAFEQIPQGLQALKQHLISGKVVARLN
ncbi:zinc-binding dehydrogenase [Loigolactobacillus jiayinensis]|uniref:Zinc-binding dehydrogenase n=1 Tax=Loigolactobacillus jiayinensis TaxID=2486016 RepID=A0ABW1RAV5_9LACO|nr:zinc-binding dehydrogenase [Loigolactobacillus jiayinensis]